MSALNCIASVQVGGGGSVGVGAGVGGCGVLAQNVEPRLRMAKDLAALYTGLKAVGVARLRSGLASWRRSMAQIPKVPKAAKT